MGNEKAIRIIAFVTNQFKQNQNFVKKITLKQIETKLY